MAEHELSSQRTKKQKLVLDLIEHLKFRCNGLLFLVSCFAPFRGYDLAVEKDFRLGELTRSQADSLLADEDVKFWYVGNFMF